MRIIAGIAKGRQYSAPPGRDTRPTLGRVKESLFSIIHFKLPGAMVLDLFSGSGGLAFESLSRGAAYAVCNDNSYKCTELIKKNAIALGFIDNIKITRCDALEAIGNLENKHSFDIVFLDPPYSFNPTEVINRIFLNKLIAKDGIVVLEHGWKAKNGLILNNIKCTDTRRYGDKGLSFFTCMEDNNL